MHYCGWVVTVAFGNGVAKWMTVLTAQAWCGVRGRWVIMVLVGYSSAGSVVNSSMLSP